MALVGAAAWCFLDKPYEVVGAEPASGGPVVILMHGYGAPGDDLVGAASSIGSEAPNASFVVLEAPHFTGLGRAWVTGGTRADAIEQVEESRQRVLATYDDMVNQGVSPDDIYLGGFSQGAQMAVDVAFDPDSGRTFAGLILLSGKFPNWPEAPAASSLAASNMSPSARVIVTHGRDDRVISFDSGKRLAQDLRPYVRTEWVPFDGGHTVAPEAELAVGRFLENH